MWSCSRLLAFWKHRKRGESFLIFAQQASYPLVQKKNSNTQTGVHKNIDETFKTYWKSKCYDW